MSEEGAVGGDGPPPPPGPNFTLIPPNGGGMTLTSEDADDEDTDFLTGQKRSGQCVICQIPTKMRCVPCTNTMSGRPVPFYCSKDHQRQDWESGGHKLTCLSTRIKKIRRAVKTPTRPIDFLVKCIQDDMLPHQTSPCYRPFGFSNCKDEREESNLLGVYVGLINILETDIDKIQEAAEAKTLGQLISSEFETLRPIPGTKGAYYPWFQENPNILA